MDISKENVMRKEEKFQFFKERGKYSSGEFLLFLNGKRKRKRKDENHEGRIKCTCQVSFLTKVLLSELL